MTIQPAQYENNDLGPDVPDSDCDLSAEAVNTSSDESEAQFIEDPWPIKWRTIWIFDFKKIFFWKFLKTKKNWIFLKKLFVKKSPVYW